MVHQFLVTLQQVEPSVWRRIQLPANSSFWELHGAISDAFGWLDYHLHQFRLPDPASDEVRRIGVPDEWDEYGTLAGWEVMTGDFFLQPGASADYHYDFGDGWKHTVVCEKELPSASGVTYPRCIDGAHACPPEDVGGPWGYADFLKAVSSPKAKDHKRMLEWCGGWFDPGWFDKSLIRFADPEIRWRILFEDMKPPKGFRMVQYHRMRQR